MAAKEKIYCLGIEAIKQYGIKRWVDEFFMPVSSFEYDKEQWKNDPYF